MSEPLITPELIKSHGLTGPEYDRVKELLGREPSFTELGIFSVMWSEHCSYKSSRVHLRRLPTTGEAVLQGPGENAGIVDVGGGLAAAFKVESHNHPSFIEPYQGAATGVGGILRDIFTMGARPLAAMNSLHFGPLKADADASEEERAIAARNRSIVAGVVKGIGDYGNAFGVPTIGGEARFSACYSRNPLVNAFTLGIVRHDQIFYGRAAGVGNPVIYVGAKTGRDGIHGATMASEEFGDEAQSKRPTVQVGDPFLEKLLLEACLEAMREGAIVGIQDMGAAGLTSSSSEMSARAGTGIEIDVDLVPQRETGMSAYEIMLSESQERMLIVAEAGRERQVIDIFKKWELDAVAIGRVTDDHRLRIRQAGEVVADIPSTALTDSAPVYNRPIKAPDAPPPVEEVGQAEKSNDELDATFMRIVTSPTVASKEWVYHQYDHMVRTNTVVLPGSDSAVIRIKEKRTSLAMTLDSNARYCQVDPRAGARLVVAESWRNLIASGARPLALTNCLNFASPERPKVMWQFSEVIDGMSEACGVFKTPVTGGNVSFYNETDGRGIYPTPVIGMVGLVSDARHVTTQWFKQEGRAIILLGATSDDLGASEYALATRGRLEGRVPVLDLDLERRVGEACLKIIEAGLVESAHDCSDGGLAVALSESAFSSYRRGAVGFEVNLEGGLEAAAHLFAETPSRRVVSAPEESADRILEIAAEHRVPASRLGRTGGERLKIKVNGEQVIDRAVAEVEDAWRGVLPGMLEVASLIAAEESLTS
ncbi:MAG TPA: phosphoribosylformylglycinamidine synthase subunit PurL [Blastocatellia bacterium]|jgi:phosphoribosylformylglycinamidine synthase|nr:phosphoribosylformylglycinamidine synthase subunit PurL [Blastocatellia bacterium]